MLLLKEINSLGKQKCSQEPRQNQWKANSTNIQHWKTNGETIKPIKPNRRSPDTPPKPKNIIKLTILRFGGVGNAESLVL